MWFVELIKYATSGVWVFMGSISIIMGLAACIATGIGNAHLIQTNHHHYHKDSKM
jgi:hypothetical protein